MAENRPAIKKVYWQDIRLDVAKIQPELAQIIDEIDPDKNYPFYLAKYLYGDNIVDDGRFYVPNESGMLVPKDSINPSNEIHKDFSYCGNLLPAGILLSNSCELTIKDAERISSVLMIKQGGIFALWRWLDKANNFHPWKIFTITAGSRSAFLLPGMRNSDCFLHLRKNFGYHLRRPKNLTDHFEIFKAIIKQTKVKNPWHSSALFFTTNWIEKILSNDPKWLALRCYLLRKNNSSSDYWRNKIFFDHSFSSFKNHKKLKPNPFIEDIVKYLISVSMGAVPAFTVATDEFAGPFALIQKVMLDIYKLEDFIPTIMHPMHFTPLNPIKPVYCSLNFLTAAEFSLTTRESIPNLDSLKEIKLLLSMYEEHVLLGNLRLDSTLTYEIIDKVMYEFFHIKEDSQREILLTSEMPKTDPSLTKSLVQCKNKVFSCNNSFVRGCIRISGII